jgi:hypothetical protein
MILGNAMSVRELFELIQRVQSGQTTPAEEMVTNLFIPKEGQLDDNDINRLYRDEPPEGG